MEEQRKGELEKGGTTQTRFMAPIEGVSVGGAQELRVLDGFPEQIAETVWDKIQKTDLAYKDREIIRIALWAWQVKASGNRRSSERGKVRRSEEW